MKTKLTKAKLVRRRVIYSYLLNGENDVIESLYGGLKGSAAHFLDTKAEAKKAQRDDRMGGHEAGPIVKITLEALNG